MSTKRISLALLGLLSVPALLLAAFHHVRTEEAWDMVRSAATAHERVSFRGRGAWRLSKWKFDVGIQHDADRGLTRYSWGKRRSYVIEGVSTRSPDPTAWCLDLDALSKSYTPRSIGATRFLDRAAHLLELLPRHAGRPRLTITVDRATSLPLKVETYRPDGELHRVVAFRTIEVGPCSVERKRKGPFKSFRGTSVPLDDLREAAGFRFLVPDYLPAGFRLQECRVKEWSGTEARLVYTDGVTRFEISQSQVVTPAHLESKLARRIGRRRAARAVERYLERRMASIAAAGESKDGLVARRCFKGSYRTYELRVGDLDVRLSSRSNLDEDETQNVLRSLRLR